MAKIAILDTNILTYSLDEANPEKQECALAVMDVLMNSQRGAVTTQTLAEFFIAITRRIAVPIPIADAYEKVEEVIRFFEVLPVSTAIILDAIRANAITNFTSGMLRSGLQQNSIRFHISSQRTSPVETS
jgi:predicted nucleic acid-binding protein